MLFSLCTLGKSKKQMMDIRKLTVAVLLFVGKLNLQPTKPATVSFGVRPYRS
jgi:hypothetical protein